MTNQMDELDRLIDAVNAGDAAAVSANSDPELTALMHAVTRIRQLQRVDLPDANWPEQTVRRLARELRADETTAAHRGSRSAESNDVQHDAPIVSLGPAPIRGEPEPPKRRSLPREFAQIAAAILVLVLVGGVLAIAFRSQPQGQSGEIGGGATPATSTSLPLSVTANGITVTLQMVDSASMATRFYVNIALPAYAVDQPTDFVLGTAPASDVQVEGLSASTHDLNPMEVDTTNTSDALLLNYPAPFPTNRTVTLTIKQLWFPAKPTRATPRPTDFSKYTPVPVVMQVLNGPWTFQISPTMLATQPLPTPASGVACTGIQQSPPPDIDCYSGISATTAQKLVGFPIIEPKPLPTSLTQDAFSVGVRRLGATSGNRANYVSLSYSPKSGQDGISLEETTDRAAVPNVIGGTDSNATPLVPSASAPTETILPGTLKTMNIDGVTVTRFEDGDARAPVLHFVWTQNGVSYHISNVYTYLIVTATPPLISDSDLLPLVTSIIEQAKVTATEVETPTSAAATPNSTSPASSAILPTPDSNGNYDGVPLAQAQQLAPFHLAQPTWVPPYLDGPEISASELEYTQINPTPVAGPIQTISLFFYGPATAKGATVTIREVKQGSAVQHDIGTRTILTIAGHTVNRAAWSDGTPIPTFAGYTGRHASYVWADQGTTFQFEALISGPVSEQDVEHMIASMIAQGSE